MYMCTYVHSSALKYLGIYIAPLRGTTQQNRNHRIVCIRCFSRRPIVAAMATTPAAATTADWNRPLDPATMACVTLTSFDDPGVTTSGAIYLVSSIFFEVTGLIGNLLSLAVFSSP